MMPRGEMQWTENNGSTAIRAIYQVAPLEYQGPRRIDRSPLVPDGKNASLPESKLYKCKDRTTKTADVYTKDDSPRNTEVVAIRGRETELLTVNLLQSHYRSKILVPESVLPEHPGTGGAQQKTMEVRIHPEGAESVPSHSR